ncbi:hypothetical protein LTSEMIN_1401 [Salmonella enterica subsp. enterica serovar Minnesota str. A4-603]|nr:hypothetical protein LTSEMIN_1401 [Salmonella enterica subsp. enterica serovar Minnesota str. A4-603]
MTIYKFNHLLSKMVYIILRNEKIKLLILKVFFCCQVGKNRFSIRFKADFISLFLQKLAHCDQLVEPLSAQNYYRVFYYRSDRLSAQKIIASHRLIQRCYGFIPRSVKDKLHIRGEL